MKTLILILLCSLNISTLAKTVTLESNSKERTDVKVYLPKKFDKKEKWPLIISLHGYGGSSRIQNIYVRLKSYKNKFGFVFASPNGLKNSEGKGFWNASNFCCDFESTQVDDVLYIKNLISRITKSPKIGRIDPQRIYLIGYSNGAFLSSKIACQSDIKVAGLVTLSGTSDLRDDNGEVSDLTSLNCSHTRAIPVLHIHGTNDETIPYEGQDNGKTGHVGAIEQVKRWGHQNGCSDELEPLSNEINASFFIRGQESERFAMKDCKAPVEHIRINNGPHFSIYRKSFTKKILEFLF
jgi:polyhydroxybutyrate depolymerase